MPGVYRMSRRATRTTMKSMKLQLLVTLAAVIISAGFLAARGLPPSRHLFDAAYTGDLSQVRRVLDWGGDPDQKKRGLWRGEQTVLHAAALRGRLEMATLLIDAGADVSALDENRQTPLHLVTRTRPPDYPGDFDAPAPGDYVETAKLLISCGAAVNARDRFGQTPLVGTARYVDVEMAAMLVDHGAEVNARDAQGQLPLDHLGSFDGDACEAFVKLMIRHGATFERTYPYPGEHTLFHEAAARGWTEVVSLLVARKSPLDVRNSGDQTPLHLAVYNGHEQTAEVLILAGTPVNLEANDSFGSNPGPLLRDLAERGWVRLMELMIDRGAAVDGAGPSGETALHRAAAANQLAAARLLLARGANVTGVDDRDQSPLCKAAGKGHLEIARLLIAKGARVNGWNENDYLEGVKPNSRCEAPLHLAGRAAMAELLIDQGADIEARPFGMTALQKAARGNKVLAEVLIAHGADVNARFGGKTPLDIAEQNKEEGIAALLRQHGGKREKEFGGREPAP